MSLITRIFLIITILAAGATIYIGLEVKKKKEQLEADLASEKATTARLTTELSAETKAKNEALATIKVKEGLLAEANAEIEKQKGELQTAAEKIKETEGKLETTTKELADAKGAMQKVLDALPPGMTPDEVAPKLKEINDQLAVLQEEKKTLTDLLKSKVTEIARLNDVVNRKSKGLLLPGTEGRILAVNDDWSFVVLDIGSKSGLVENGKMLVTRGGTVIGRIKITAVEPTVAIADILPEWKQAPIQEGDLVTASESL
jgi:cell division protein YceG involved in septum cleavage